MTQAARPVARPLAHFRLPAVSPSVAFALRSGIAVSAAIWLGKAPGLVENSSVWILISVLTVLQPTTGNSMLRGLARIVGTIAAAVTSILLFGLFAQTPPLMMAAFFLVQVMGAYGNTGRRFQYAWFVWAFTTAIILADSLVGAGAVEVVAFQRASMVGIGILLVLFVETVFWPTRAEPKLRGSLAARARALGAEAAAAIASLGAGRSDDERAAALDATGLAGQLALVDAARTELGVAPETAQMLARVVLLLESLGSRVRALENPVRERTRGGGDAAFQSAVRVLADQVQEASADAAVALEDRTPLAPFSEGLDRALLDLEVPVARLVSQHGGDEVVDGRLADVRDVIALLRSLEAELDGRAPTQSDRSSRSASLLQLDPVRAKLALRTGVAVTIVIVLVLALGWPMNAVVAPMAFLVAPLTRGALRLTLPAMGAMILVGWALADVILVTLTPEIQRMPLALAIPFALSSGLGYLAAKKPPLAAAPLLVGLVTLLPVFGGTRAVPNVYGSYDTVCYMALALAVGGVLGQLMWPATSAGVFRQRIAAQLEQCLETTRDAIRFDETTRRRRVRELTQTCSLQMAQIGPLHEQARHEPIERALDAKRRSELIALTTDLMDAVASFRPLRRTPPSPERSSLAALWEAVAREDEAMLGSMRASIDRLRGDDDDRTPALAEEHATLRSLLDGLRTDPESLAPLEDAVRDRWLVALDSRRNLVERQLELERWVTEWRAAESSV